MDSGHFPRFGGIDRHDPGGWMLRWDKGNVEQTVQDNIGDVPTLTDHQPPVLTHAPVG
jgi:hypothetical protein